MTLKTPTAWDANTDKLPGVAYSSSSVTYSSSSTAYSSATTALDEFGKQPMAWTRQTKAPDAWLVNPASVTNLYLFDSASHTYDSAVDTYDGVVSGQDFGDTKVPALWSQA